MIQYYGLSHPSAQRPRAQTLIRYKGFVCEPVDDAINSVKLGRDQRLHYEDGAEASLTLRNPLVGRGSLGQRVGFNYRFDFPLRYVIQGFI